MSLYVSGLLWVAGAAALGALTAYLVRRIGLDEGRPDNNDAAGQVFTIISGLQAVLVAFVLISLFDAVSEARDGVREEADSIVAMSWAADALPGSTPDEVRELGRNYLTTVLEQEWPKLHTGAEPGGPGWDQLDRLHAAIAAAEISNKEYVSDQKAEADRYLWGAYQAREERIDRVVHDEVGDVVWFALILGGIIATLLPNLFGGTRLFTHVVLVSTVAGTITLLLFAIYQLQNPFGGAAKVEPEAFRAALERLR